MSQTSSSTLPAKALSYRPDIDGLRAIAVVSVILFHISDRLLPGGFIGVDIFFTISGYLITKIIASQMEKGEFSFTSFYLHRIRRILPVFVTVVAATILIGRILLLPKDFLNLLNSARRAALFSANLYFSKGQGYFAQKAGEQPLLHTWSLSVEEQFYFIWPVLVFILLMAGTRLGVERRRTFALAVTAIVLVLSFAAGEHLLHAASNAAYYSLVSRAGELLGGACVALAPFADRKRINGWLTAIGVSGIAVALVTINRNTPYPGWLALLPTASAALILYAGQSNGASRGYIARILGNRYLVYIGLLSYSLYLWHWPVLAFMRYGYPQEDLPASWLIIAAALTLVLSMLSYHFIEASTKRRRMQFGRALTGFYLAPVVVLFTVSLVTSKWVFPGNYDPVSSDYHGEICFNNLTRNCVRGAANMEPHVLVIGDSHAAALSAFVDTLGQHEGWAARVVSASACSPVADFDPTVLGVSGDVQHCEALMRYVRENYLKYDVIVVAQYWALQLNMTNRMANVNYLGELVNSLRTMARERPVYVLSDTPLVSGAPARLPLYRRIGLNLDDKLSEMPTSAKATAIVKEAVTPIPNVHWVDLSPEFQAFSPPGYFKGQPAYIDTNHLNIYGSRSLATLMIEENKRLLPATGSHLAVATSKQQARDAGT